MDSLESFEHSVHNGYFISFVHLVVVQIIESQCQDLCNGRNVLSWHSKKLRNGVRGLEDLLLFHHELSCRCEDHVTLHSSVIAITRPKSKSIILARLTAIWGDCRVSGRATEHWSVVAKTRDCRFPFFMIQKAFRERTVVRILQCE
jgi:hypothetical protein